VKLQYRTDIYTSDQEKKSHILPGKKNLFFCEYTYYQLPIQLKNLGEKIIYINSELNHVFLFLIPVFFLIGS